MFHGGKLRVSLWPFAERSFREVFPWIVFFKRARVRVCVCVRGYRVVAHYRDCGERSLRRFLKVSVSFHLWWRSCRTTCWYPQGRSVRPDRGCLCAYPGRLKTSCWKEDNVVVIGSSFDNLSYPSPLIVTSPLVSRSLEIPRGRGSYRGGSFEATRGCVRLTGHRRTRDHRETENRP